MKILIAVPTKGRFNRIKNKVHSWLQHTKYDFKYFVEPQEFDLYKQEIGAENIVRLQDNDRGLSFAKGEIKLYAKRFGYDLIFKIDDDVYSWRNPINRGLGKSAPKISKEDGCRDVFDKLVANCIEAFEISTVGGIAFKYGSEMRDYDENKVFDRVNSRFQTCYITRTDLFHADEKIYCFEDFINFIHILEEGFITLRYSLSGMDNDPVGTNEGGIQSFDRKKKNEEDREYIMLKYPNLPWKRVEGKNWEYEPDFKQYGVKSEAI